jgi:hypothetical protein
MDADGQVVTVGTRGLGRGHRGDQNEALLVQNEVLEVQMLLRWQKVSTQLIQRDHEYSPAHQVINKPAVSGTLRYYLDWGATANHIGSPSRGAGSQSLFCFIGIVIYVVQNSFGSSYQDWILVISIDEIDLIVATSHRITKYGQEP